MDYDLLTGRNEDQRCIARVEVSDNVVTIDGEGSGPIEAFVNAMVETLNEPLTVLGTKRMLWHGFRCSSNLHPRHRRPRN